MPHDPFSFRLSKLVLCMILRWICLFTVWYALRGDVGRIFFAEFFRTGSCTHRNIVSVVIGGIRCIEMHDTVTRNIL